MQALKIEATDQTPKVTLNKDTNTFEFSGRSLSEDAMVFYRPVIQWMTEYANKPNANTEVSFKMEYMNTSSSKALFDFFAILQTIAGSKIIWYFQDEDEDMEETGEEFSALVKIPFEMRAY